MTVDAPNAGRRRNLLCSGAMLALGTWTLGQALSVGAAQAQCNPGDGAPPPPPAPSVQSNVSNQTFGAPPLTPYVLNASGKPGCDGAKNEDPNAVAPYGGPGQQGGSITATGTNVNIVGGAVSNPNQSFTTYGAYLQSFGGTAGTGGEGANGGGDGGMGGPGGPGGTITVRLGVNLVPFASGVLATYGITQDASGGNGGAGGMNDNGGIYAKAAGNGAAGGVGGSVQVVASGSIQASTGLQAIAGGGAGGGGGKSDSNDIADDKTGGAGGPGGQGGTISVRLASGTITAPRGAIIAGAFGGQGGLGGATGPYYSTQGGNGGVGGNGGNATVQIDPGAAAITNPDPQSGLTSGNALQVTANGGNGGNGGVPGGAPGQGGGSGGNGGTGGNAAAIILGAVTFNGFTGAGQSNPPAILVQSNGGGGGQGAGVAGAIVGSPGGGGFAGPGGSASLVLGTASSAGTVRTSGNFAHGALVQSIGGAGGNGGNASFVFGGGSGGAGAPGGDGGAIGVSSTVGSTVVVQGDNAAAVLAQSVGGGGGVGGDASDITLGASYVLGGNGGLGGNGSTVRVVLDGGVFASTSTLGGAGIVAQSIGGSGGIGGSASASGVGLISVVVGGDAGGGGTGGNLTVNTGGLVTTYGDHAAGIQAQSIGGGGGKAGSALSFIADLGPTASVSVGGRGGGGGAAGNVQAANTGQVTTYGADAPGVLMQSIGGGGGSGGAAAARAVSLSPSKYIPAVSISVSTGGAGGSGNTGGSVGLTNSGLITTAGDAAFGVMAQSVGGGGGTGGDATSAAYSSGPQGGVSIAVAVAVGGSGGSGGTGGGVSLANSGLIATLGQDAYGVFAQSVGGGGGTGGGGDATSSAGGAKAGFGASITVGGKGGTGGDAGIVSLSNTGAVTTAGDGADAVFAQSVGGGGGAGGGGVGTASGSKVSVNVTLGGNGGAAGIGNTVTANNSGSIVTRGTDAIGLSLQSVGGGGGKAGKGGSTAGGVNPVSNAGNLFGILDKGLNFGQDVQNLGNGILQVGTLGKEIQATYAELAGIFKQADGGPSSIGTVDQINVSVSVGGQGGAAGNGGAVNATNTGTIGTFGAQSDGIFAQSVGGGGGSGGAATSTAKAANDMAAQTSVAVGGNGGGGGKGGPVTVTNTAGTITTQGVLAFGVLAQSVGGGGGDGSTAGTVDGSLKSLGVGLGGNGGGAGDGGAVSVTNTGAITTSGKHGLGILAQSIGGGGGLVRTMTTDETFDPAKILNNPQGRLADIHGVSLSLGGQNGANGNGGSVSVTNPGTIATTGLDAHAIVAQSIGGGGGAVIGGQTTLTSAGSGNAGGEGGPVSVTLSGNSAPARISTSGAGAAGIIAQSIGGGGGLAGDFSAVRSITPGAQGLINPGTGNGGTVAINLNNAFVTTSGPNANAIVAQSIGGGGGLVAGANATTANAGNAVIGLGIDAGGAIAINLVNSTVLGGGDGASGIVANSAGDNGNNGPITITIDQNSRVAGGKPDMNAAINLIYGANNRIENQGTIVGWDQDPQSATAIFSNVTAAGSTTLVNTGTIQGKIVLPAQAGSFVENRLGGSIDATVIDLGAKGRLTNAGALEIGGKGRVGATSVTGDFVQTATGTLMVDIDPASGTADRLQVNGRATIGGTITGVATSTVRLKPGATRYSLLTATGGVVRDASAVTVGGTPVVRYELVVTDANTLSFDRTVDLGGTRALADQGLTSSNRSEVGRALNTVFAGEAGGLTKLGDRLAALPTSSALAATLDALSGEAVADVQQTVFATQQLFNTTLLRHATETGTGTGASSRPYATASLAPTPPPNDQGLRVWIGGFGGSDVIDGSDGRGSLHTQIAGGLIGLDKWFDADRMVGISVGGGSTDFTVADRGGRGHGTSVQVGGYGLASFGPAYVSGVVSYGNVDTTVQRARLGGATGLVAASRGSVNSNVLGSQIEAGWRQNLGAVTLTPFASLSVNHVWQSPVSESETGPDATGLGLRYAALERTSVPLTLGGRLGSTFGLAGGRSMTLSAEVGWVHEFNTSRSVQAAFSAAPTTRFQVLGVNASADSAVIGLNSTLALTKSVALLGNFTGRFSGIETAVGGFGGLQVKW